MKSQTTVALAVSLLLTVFVASVSAQGMAPGMVGPDGVQIGDDSAASKKEKNPIGASVRMGYSFNQMQFVECEGQDCGWQRLSVGLGIFYGVTSFMSISSGLNAGKTLETSFTNAGTASRTTQTPWEVRDVGLSVLFPGFLKMKPANLTMGGSVAFGFPLSKPSRAAGLIMSVSPGLNLTWQYAGITASLSGGYTYFWNDDPTVPIDCDRAPYNCIVSGNDSGNPNALHSINGSLFLGYSIIKPLSVTTSYSISRGMGAVEYANDDATSSFAQSGDQWGLERHSFNVGMNYTFLASTTLAVGMRTGGSLYTADNSEVQLPFYDGSLRQAFRTSYSMSLIHQL